MKKLLKKIVSAPRSLKRRLYDIKLRWQDWRAGRQLTLTQDRLNSIKPGGILLFACLRNEKFRMQFFVEYYRKLGVEHFLFIDNDSSDGFTEWAAQQLDVTVWRTTASYKASAFGMQWINDLLRKHGVGHWCVVVDADEFLVYPYMETRSLRALTTFLEEERRSGMHTVTLDAYSDKPMNQTVLDDGKSPFQVCRFFDKDGYLQKWGWSSLIEVRGGPRMRTLFADKPGIAPALHKIPLVKWQPGFHYRRSTHDAFPPSLNKAHAPGTISVTGALFHFKLIAQLQHKAEEEMVRKEHYRDGREYERYLDGSICFYESGISEEYQGTQQLVRLGLMSPGKWF